MGRGLTNVGLCLKGDTFELSMKLAKKSEVKLALLKGKVLQKGGRKTDGVIHLNPCG